MEDKSDFSLKKNVGITDDRDDLNEIVKGLFLGNIQAAYDTKKLESLNIKYILTLDLYPICNNTNDPAIQIKFVQVVDNDKEDILHCFNDCITFIEDALAQDGKVLVHCHAGVSRSAAVVVAYLMKKHGKNVRKALATIRAKRDVSPNRGFLFQLELFHRMGCKIDTNFRGYKKYRLKYAASQVVKAKILPRECMDVVKPDPGLEQTNPDPVVYRCRKCRRIVATRKNIMTHSVIIKTDTKGPNKSKETINSDPNLLIEKDTTENLESLPNIMKSCTLSSDKSLDRSSEIEICNKIYFVEPLSWMNAVNNIQGCLKCPKCSSKLGNFNWIEACICPCGAKVSPAFYFVPSKVEYANVVKNVQVTV